MADKPQATHVSLVSLQHVVLKQGFWAARQQIAKARFQQFTAILNRPDVWRPLILIPISNRPNMRKLCACSSTQILENGWRPSLTV